MAAPACALLLYFHFQGDAHYHVWVKQDVWRNVLAEFCILRIDVPFSTFIFYFFFWQCRTAMMLKTSLTRLLKSHSTTMQKQKQCSHYNWIMKIWYKTVHDLWTEVFNIHSSFTCIIQLCKNRGESCSNWKMKTEVWNLANCAFPFTLSQN